MTATDLTLHIKKSGLSRRDWYRTIYLFSEHWKDLRRQKFEQSGRLCEACKTNKNIQVHHLRYRNIYDVETSDLQVLCRKHHKEQHPEHQKKGKKSRRKSGPPALQGVRRNSRIMERSEIEGVIKTFRFQKNHKPVNSGRRTIPKPMSESVERNLWLFYSMVLREKKKLDAAINNSRPGKAIKKKERSLAIAEQRFRNYVNSLPDYVLPM